MPSSRTSALGHTLLDADGTNEQVLSQIIEHFGRTAPRMVGPVISDDGSVVVWSDVPGQLDQLRLMK